MALNKASHALYGAREFSDIPYILWRSLKVLLQLLRLLMLRPLLLLRLFLRGQRLQSRPWVCPQSCMLPF
jgi:hypothetical protein